MKLKTKVKPSLKSQSEALRDGFLHVTIDSGNVCHQQADSVHPATCDQLIKAIQQSIQSGMPVPVPGETGVEMKVEQYSDSYAIKIDVLYAGFRDELLTFGVATKGGAGARVWKMLHDMPGVGQFLFDSRRVTPLVPGKPWIAVRLSVGNLRARLTSLKWLDFISKAGHLECCVAFALAKMDGEAMVKCRAGD